jgi:hypothetical protein
VLTLFGLAFLVAFLFAEGMTLRRKGFEAPLIAIHYLPAALASGAVFVVGVWLFLSGSKKASDKTNCSGPTAPAR